MRSISILLLLLLSIFTNCKKEIADPLITAEARPVPVVPTTEPAVGVADYDLNESTLGAAWTKVWEDNFDADLSKWNIWVGGAYNNELQHYRSQNLRVQNGSLFIDAIKETVIGNTLPNDQTQKTFDYTSGRIESIEPFSASVTTPKVRIAARIKLPSGYGMWPAFWSYGDPWPTQGEIDILEARGNEPTKYQTAYWYGKRAGVNTTKGTEGYVNPTGANDLTAAFHVYEVIWEQNQLSYYFDGRKVVERTGNTIPNFFGKSQQVVLNVAVGGGFFPGLVVSNIRTGTMEVDWVKVFTSQ